MEYRRMGDTIALRLDPGDEIVGQILAVAEKENVTFASVTGIGGTDEAEYGVFDMQKKGYNRFACSGTHEITALTGNVNTMQGAPYAHLHITLAGADGRVVGGHLLRCVISLTAEIFLHTLPAAVDRTRREDLQINTWAFDAE
ncbi:MAG: DNA-binding protein [Clostridia bacterium]|nr:DNA-binding protein [Clostridia bacterium]